MMADPLRERADRRSLNVLRTGGHPHRLHPDLQRYLLAAAGTPDDGFEAGPIGRVEVELRMHGKALVKVDIDGRSNAGSFWRVM